MRAVRRLTEEGVLKIIDFGLSHVYPRTAGGAVDRSTPLLDVAGSPAYCAPEARRRARCVPAPNLLAPAY